MSEKSEKEEKQGDEDKAGPSKKRSRAESEDASQDIRLDHPDRQIGPYGEYDEENLSCPICCEIFFNPTARKQCNHHSAG